MAGRASATTVDNGDPDEIEAFVHEFLAHAQAGRQGSFPFLRVPAYRPGRISRASLRLRLDRMGDVLTFTPRLKPVAPEILAPLTGTALRASLEEAAQTALDAADRIIAVLDSMDGDADHEDGADDQPSLAAPENTACSQVVYMRGGDRDHEVDAPETVLPEVATTPATKAEILPWRGRGNLIAAAGSFLVDLLERA